MKQHGRKSVEAIAAAMAKPSVIKGGFGRKRLEPPEDLPEGQAKIWRETVAGEPSDFFNTAATRALLTDYCRHRFAANEFAALIDAFPPEHLVTPEGMRRYDWLSKQMDRNSQAASRLATKLRLTNQSRWQPQSAAIKAEAALAESNPWDDPIAQKA